MTHTEEERKSERRHETTSGLWGHVSVGDPFRREDLGAFGRAWFVEVRHHNGSGAICMVRASRDMEATSTAMHVAQALRMYDEHLQEAATLAQGGEVAQ